METRLIGKSVDPVFEDMIERARAEGISRAGGLDRSGILEAGLVSFLSAAVGLGSVGSVGREHERDLILVDDLMNPFFKIFFTGHESDLVVGDLEDVALGEAEGDLLLGFLFAAPQRRA